MKFSLRDLFLVTVIVALACGWWVDRSNSRRELQRVKINLALEEKINKHMTFRAKVLSDLNAVYMETEKKERASINERERHYEQEIHRLRRLAQPPLPDSSAPAPNPPKP